MDYRFINHDELVDIIRTKTAEQRTDQSVQDLVSRLEDVPRVIFHCTLSQVRGPKAARIYAEARREKERDEAARGAPQAVGGTVSDEGKSADAGKESAVATNVDPFETAKATAAAAAASSSLLRQEVLVLRDGFQGWQGLYRKDPDLVENFDVNVWQEYSP
ncbi:hypothetical protein C6P46_003539 [Rhodotorula mucilaginosa]|uniref:Rhodanese domain-containing protein n=1 Tax=Rhodotorula mucilaginosa TaxID=5537 RepID=A0A9P7B1C4_RHOMI|nr:hypothetical protein C6P46_003539 [Rhodotorula mucilaginosa]